MPGAGPPLEDPDAAGVLVRRGAYTYLQAVNLAKIGRVRGVTYKPDTGSMVCRNPRGLAAHLDAWRATRRGRAQGDACSKAGAEAVTMATNLIFEPEAQIYGRLFDGVFSNVVFEYALTDAEQAVMATLMQRLDPRVFQALGAALRTVDEQEREICSFLVPLCEMVRRQPRSPRAREARQSPRAPQLGGPPPAPRSPFHSLNPPSAPRTPFSTVPAAQTPLAHFA